MKLKRKLFASLLVFCLLLVSSPLVGYCADTTASLNPVTVTMSVQQYETLKDSMKTLKENSMKQSKLLKEQSQQIKTLKEQLTVSQTQTMNSQDSMQKTKTLLSEQNKSLTTLTEQINKESHKRMVVQRQRDAWAVIAGLFICSSAYETLN